MKFKIGDQVTYQFKNYTIVSTKSNDDELLESKHVALGYDYLIKLHEDDNVYDAYVNVKEEEIT